MIGKITEKVMLSHVEKRLRKYNIQLVHFVPGRLRLKSSLWKEEDDLIHILVCKLKEQVLVYDAQFTKETGSLLITYDASHVGDMRELQSWFDIMDALYKQRFYI